jgi:hypothetical protein
MSAASEHKRLARARTLLMVAASKVAAVPDNHPRRREMAHKLNAIKDALKAKEREAAS